MNLYLISQDRNSGYDTYDSAVVAAMSEEEAREIVPGGFWMNSTTVGDGSPNVWRPPNKPTDADYDTWATPQHVNVQLLGVAIEGTESGKVICASFNAG